jgi:hypothetical protein
MANEGDKLVVSALLTSLENERRLIAAGKLFSVGRSLSGQLRST